MKDMVQNKKYPAYKDSGVEWLGEIPEHWETVPGFTIVSEQRDKNIGMIRERVLSLSYGNVIVKPKEKLRGLVPESFETYQLVDVGDIIIRPTDLQNDHTSLRTGLAKNEGIITSAYINLRCNKEYSCRYYHYFLHATDLTKVIYGLGSGLRQNIDFRDFKRFGFLLIPPDEQTAIANFLDEKTGRIDQAIAQKEQLIDLLKERKQIIIQNAVTKGLDPTVPMKDSGVEWIGEIPEHWDVKRFCRIFDKVQTGTTPTTSNPQFFNGDISWYNPTDLNETFPKKSVKTISNLAVNRGEAKIFPEDSVMIVGIGATCGKTSYLSEEASFNQQITGFHSRSEMNIFCMHSIKCFSGVMLETASFTTLPILNNQFFHDFQIPIPPDDEQKDISKFIDTESVKFEDAITQASQAIEKLKEYKATLINSAVTGKIKVC